MLMMGFFLGVGIALIIFKGMDIVFKVDDWLTLNFGYHRYGDIMAIIFVVAIIVLTAIYS